MPGNCVTLLYPQLKTLTHKALIVWQNYKYFAEGEIICSLVMNTNLINMRKNFLTILVLLSVISIQSCKKDSKENTEKPDPTKIYLISKITIHYANNITRIEEYKYDAQNRISQSRSDMYTETAGDWETFNYVYDNTNKLTRAEMVSYDNRVLTTRLFTYNTNATAGDQVYEQTDNGVTAIVYPISLYADGRVKFVAKRSAIKYDSQGRFSYYGAPERMNELDETFQFDTKKNPFFNVAGINPNINYLVEVYPIATLNNLLTINNLGSKVITYNMDDFPVKSVYTSITGNVETVDYEYIIK
jgi:hypothetical protein